MLVVDPNTDPDLPQPQYDPERPRHWVAHFVGGRQDPLVMVRRYAILKPDEDLTENPPWHEMSQTEWASHHGEYGLDIDGQTLGGAQ